MSVARVASLCGVAFVLFSATFPFCALLWPPAGAALAGRLELRPGGLATVAAFALFCGWLFFVSLALWRAPEPARARPSASCDSAASSV